MRRSVALPLQYRRLLARVAAARRVRRAAAGAADLSPERRASIDTDALSFFANLPLRARLANRFTDAMFAIEDALSMCEVERAESRDASWIEPRIRTTYEQVNALMKEVCD
jgi:Leu/Phe-tRNA-protein transferase